MAAPPPPPPDTHAPSAEELEEAKSHLHHAPPAPPKSGVDPQVLAIYQATFDRDFPTGGMALVCETLGLDTVKYPGAKPTTRRSEAGGTLRDDPPGNLRGYLSCTTKEEFTKMSLGAEAKVPRFGFTWILRKGFLAFPIEKTLTHQHLLTPSPETRRDRNCLFSHPRRGWKTMADPYGSIYVILAEDEEMFMDLAASALESIGVPEQNLRTAEDGQEALNHFDELRRQEPSARVLAFLDVRMSGMDGTEAAKEIKRREVRQPFLVCCSANITALEKAEDGVFDLNMPKNFSDTDVL
ncbi:unnamed protein product [Durusdinium trenchii]|uniref:Response regulatory domain-containing protein n=1 Tax=Durusdinium trenchii TaxID=1381693 RepID=A0ABP0SCB3_9DINO